MTAPACANHPAVESVKECASCHRPFCDDCVVELGGWTYCGWCKNQVVSQILNVVEFAMPREAFIMAIVSLFVPCVGAILAGMALYRGFRAMGEIKRDPRLPGYGLAVAAVIIASLVCLLYLVNIGMFVLSLGGTFKP